MIPPETFVVNLRKEKCDFKACRDSKGKIPLPPLTGWLGNPYKQYDRAKNIALFREYFLKRLEEDSGFRRQVLMLKGLTLGCFCKPLDCHVDVIKEWLDEQAGGPDVKSV